VSRSDDQRMQDILDAADQILDVVKDGQGIWAKDRLRQLAVERLLEIIGEPANALSDEFRAQFPLVPWRTSPEVWLAASSAGRKRIGLSP
jgi:uncharacterized protein with HEPN domain